MTRGIPETRVSPAESHWQTDWCHSGELSHYERALLDGLRSWRCCLMVCYLVMIMLLFNGVCYFIMIMVFLETDYNFNLTTPLRSLCSKHYNSCPWPLWAACSSVGSHQQEPSNRKDKIQVRGHKPSLTMGKIFHKRKINIYILT